MKFGSLFSGGGLADVGARDAGFEPVFANEIDQKIAEVYRANLGDHILVGSILEQDPRDYPYVDLLHASPPCPNFSVAKRGGVENSNDIALADKVGEFIRVLKPRWFTLENVPKYRKSESFKRILGTLHTLGYMVDAQLLNAADFGVPQTRQRLWVRACRDELVPHLPEPVEWVGWYEAIEDLIPTLPESHFAKWQLARLPQEMKDNAIFGNQQSDDRKGTEFGYGVCVRSGDEPALTARVGVINIPRAFVMESKFPSRNQKEMFRRFNDVTGTVTSLNPNWKAFVMQVQGEGGDGMKAESEPMQTLTQNHSAKKYRAFVMLNQNSSSAVTRSGAEPSSTVGNINRVGNRPRAWLETGRVVSMTPRALARFQSVPDEYVLPAQNALACRIIGNGVPCLEYKVIAGLFLP